MRRVPLLPALALILAPGAALAQGAPAVAQQQGGTGGAGSEGATAAPAGGTGAAASGSTAGSASEGAPRATSAESTPASPASAGSTSSTSGSSTEPASSIHPTPAPENLDTRTSPILELHGYLRSRMEFFNNFGLGWDAIGAPNTRPTVTDETRYNSAGIPWYRNPDYSAQWCFTPPTTGPLTAMPGSCSNNSQTSANMRLRLEPEIHPTEFITIHSQIDVLDNLVLGSTPEGYYVPGNTRSVWAPLTAFTQTQLPPVAGYNSFSDSIMVKRAWAEVTNQTLGQIRFGRMPSNWGLGLVANAGNGYDSDYQSTVDRFMYAARIRPLGLFLVAAWDFPSSGATSATRVNEPSQGQPYDLAQFDNVNQWVVALGRSMEPDQQRAALARGEWVVNGGLYFVYRNQVMSGEHMNTVDAGTASPGSRTYGMGLIRRDAEAFIPDLWFQVLRSNFRFEMEAVYIRGSLGALDYGPNPTDLRYTIEQFGAAAEMEYRLLNNRLSIEFRTGYASGDPDIEGLNYFNGLQAQRNGNRTISTFRFHPDYRIDLIFWRQIMRQISGAYYFRPSVQYNFIDEPNGDLFFGRVDVIWSRASEFIQTRGNHSDLGVEIDAHVTYQSNHRRPDGTTPTRPAPGFYATVQYGAFFPLAGLGPTDAERPTGSILANFSSQIAQTIRGYLGVQF